MRFETPADVKAWARKAAASDYARHLVIHEDADGTKWQIDKNPYTTTGARHDWQRGFDNAPAHPWTTDEFCTIYQRGRAMAELIESQNPKVAA